MKFTVYGHENVLSTHKATLEFTKDKHLTLRGNCILGINANFELKNIKKLLSKKKLKITIKAKGVQDSITCDINPNFNHESQIVIRKSGFLDSRTLGINANKASSDIKRKLVNYLKDPENKAEVIIR